MNDMKIDDVNSPEIDEILLDSQLDTPDTSELKSRIMKLTSTMPQQLDNDAVVFAEDKPTEEKVLFLSKFFKPKFITPFAVAASIVFMAVLWVPSGFQQDETNPHFLSEAETSFSEDKEHLAEAEASFTVNDDLDFQETMVFFDEQMFVQL